MDCFQLQYYQWLGVDEIWEVHDPKADFGIDLNDGVNTIRHFNFLSNATVYGDYVGYQYGLDARFRGWLGDLMPLYI